MRVLRNRNAMTRPLKEQHDSSQLGVRAQQLWSEWEINCLVLTSFSLQVFLLFFAVMRKRSTSRVLKVLLWLAYLSADYVAIFILGHLTFHVDDVQRQLVVFWAPFLLLHLGGPDTITAFSMEDNDLWKRHLLNLVSQVALAVYVVGKQWRHQDKQLHAPMVLMFISGMIKYAERTWALYRVGSSTPGSKSIVAKASYDLGINAIQYYDSLVEIISSKQEKDFTRLLSLAAFRFGGVLDIFMDVSPSKSVSINGVSKIADAVKKSQSSEDRVHMAYKLADIHLSLIYDYLYTKFGSRYIFLDTLYDIGPMCSTIHRLISFGLTSAALVLFVRADLTKYKGADVTVSYILLIGAITLEVSSIFMGCISSYWSHIIIPGAWLSFCYGCPSEWASEIFDNALRHLHLGNTARGEWSGKLAQYNLISGCIQERQAAGAGLWEKMLRYIGFKGDTTLVATSPELKKAVLDRLLQVVTAPQVKEWDLTRFHGLWAQWAVGAMHHESSTAAKRALEASCIQGQDFVSNVIIWHYTTDFCFFTREADDNSELRATCMELSNYMMHLIAKHKVMVGSDGLYLVGRAQKEVEGYLHGCGGVDHRYHLSHQMHYDPPVSYRYAGLHQAQCVYKELLQITKECDRWELIAAVWVEMLCYMAHNCGARFHAKHLSIGGEFVTHVRMLLIILGLPFLTDLKKTIPYTTPRQHEYHDRRGATPRQHEYL